VFNLGVPILDFRGLSISHPQGHGELGPPQTCRMEAGAGSDHDGTRNMSRVPGRQFVIFIQVSNRGRFCQYISLPMKYTVSGSILQYNVGLTLSFLSLISRGVVGLCNPKRKHLLYELK
jgi:hypothetical protein